MIEDNSGLVESFDDSLEKLSDLAIDFSEVGLDTVLEDGLLKELPVIKWFYTAGRIAVTVRDAIYLNKVIVFFRELKANNLSPEDIQKHREALDSPKKFQKELEVIIKYIDSSTRDKQVEILARVFQGFLMRNISSDVFDELVEVNNRMFIGDYDLIGRIAYAGERLITKDDYSAINRLISLGLVSANDNSETKDTIKRKGRLTDLGSAFANYVDIKRYSESEMRKMTLVLFSQDSSKYNNPNELEHSSDLYAVDASQFGKGIYEYELYDENGNPILGIYVYDRLTNNVRCWTSKYYTATRFLPRRCYFTLEKKIIQNIKGIVGGYTSFDDGVKVEYNTSEDTIHKQVYRIRFGDECRSITAYNLAQCEFDINNKSKTIYNSDAKELVELHSKIKELLVSSKVDPAYFSFSSSNSFSYLS